MARWILTILVQSRGHPVVKMNVTLMSLKVWHTHLNKICLTGVGSELRILDLQGPNVCECCKKQLQPFFDNRGTIEHFIVNSHGHSSNEEETALELVVACGNITGKVCKRVSMHRNRAVIDVYEEIICTVYKELIILDTCCA